MRISLANNYAYLRGGAEKVMLTERNLLIHHGHQVAVFAQKDEKGAVGEESRFYPEKPGYDSPRFWERIRSLPGFIYSSKARRHFADHLQAYPADILHAHNIYGGLTPSILAEAKAQGIPSVMTLHDYKLMCPTYQMLSQGKPCELCLDHRYFHAVQQKCHRNSTTSSGVYALESYFNLGLGNYDPIHTFICPSQFLKTMAIRSGISEERLMVIPNAVDANAVMPSFEDNGYYLYAGRLSHEKGILTLIEVFQLLGLPLILAGEGPLQEACEKKAAFSQNIQLVGHLQGPELENRIRGARALILPSEWYENAPMILIEAAALGKPVIAANIGGIPEMVVEGHTGYLFTSGQAEDLQDKVRLLEDSPILRRQLGRQARERVLVEYSFETHYENLMKVYRSAIGRAL